MQEVYFNISDASRWINQSNRYGYRTCGTQISESIPKMMLNFKQLIFSKLILLIIFNLVIGFHVKDNITDHDFVLSCFIMSKS
jgi:hypothetical protein